jgi:hypothetical protein
MANGFWPNETFIQIEHKKLTSLIKMANVLKANGTSYVYYVPTSHLPFTILQPTYLLTNPPTYLYVIPTYQPTNPPTYLPT